MLRSIQETDVERSISVSLRSRLMLHGHSAGEGDWLGKSSSYIGLDGEDFFESAS